MPKSKKSGILMISLSIIVIILVTGYTILLSIFGIASGGSFFMLIPLLIISIVIITAMSFLLYAGIKQIKNK